MLAIPLSVLVDWLFKGYVLPWHSFVGVGMILIGFFGLVMSQFWEMRKKKMLARKEAEDVKESNSRTFLIPKSEEYMLRSRLLSFLI